MDSPTILETASKLSALLKALTKTLASTAELRRQWGNDDLTTLTLENQLLTLRGALSQTMHWIEQAPASGLGLPNLHHQLVLGLDRCIACCRLLLTKIDADMIQLQRTPAGQKTNISKLLFKMRNVTMDLEGMGLQNEPPNQRPSKIVLALKTRNLKKLQPMIQQQTTALTLILTACNTAAISQQEALLADPHTRRVLDAMEDNTSSLFMRKDTDSVVMSSSSSSSSSSRFGGASKQLLKFDFDRQLFVSHVYRQWSRGFSEKPEKGRLPNQATTGAQDVYVETSEKFLASNDIVETREKFSILPPIITDEKLVPYDLSEVPVETREKFTVDATESTEKYIVDRRVMSPVETKDKFVVSPADESPYSATVTDLSSPSSPSSLALTRTKESSTRTIWKPRRLTAEDEETKSLRKRSKTIDNMLKEEQKTKRPNEWKVLLFGSESRSYALVAAQLRAKKIYTSQELEAYRDVILNNLKDCTRMLVQQIRYAKVNPDSRYLWAYLDLIDGYCDESASEHASLRMKLDNGFFEALQAVLEDALVADLVKSRTAKRDEMWPGPAQYYFDCLSRISSSDYMPTELDIIHATTFLPKSGGINNATIHDGKLNIELVNVGGLAGKRGKWIHQFEAAQMVVYVVNLEECHESGQMIETLQSVKDLVASRWFSQATIIILLDVRTAYGPAESANANLVKTALHTLERFQQLDPERLSVSLCSIVNDGNKVIEMILSAIREKILQTVLIEDTLSP